MKFLTLNSLASASSSMNDIDTGDSLIYARMEGYSCKRAGTDKKLYKDLETQYKAELARSPELSLSVSPFGPMVQKRSRETLIELISTLNAAFQDYDFSSLRGEHFVKEELWQVVNHINSRLESTIPNYEEFKGHIWAALESEIQLQDCAIYSFVPDVDSNPFEEEGYVWSFNYFFYNKKKLKRIVLWTCYAQWKGEDEVGLTPTTETSFREVDADGDFDMEVMMNYNY